MSSSDEGGLARRVRTGDREAFGELVRLHERAVFNVAYRMLGNTRDAEDAAQDTFLRAYRFFDRYDPGRPLGPWLRKMAANLCLNRIEAAHPAAEFDEEATAAPDPHPGPEAQLLIRDRERLIRAALLKLPPRLRLVIELRHFQDLSYEEIAAELGRPLSDVKSDLFRARQVLAERLKDLR
jgi:RNA polymerase sigma-70 factor, ECF subfamily